MPRKSTEPAAEYPEALSHDFSWDAATLELRLDAWDDGEPVIVATDKDAVFTALVEFGLGRSRIDEAIVRAERNSTVLLGYAQLLRQLKAEGRLNPSAIM